MTLNFDNEIVESGDTGEFVTKFRSTQLKMQHYAAERNAKDGEIDQSARQAAAAAEQAEEAAGESGSAKQAAQAAALQAEEHAGVAAKIEGRLNEADQLAVQTAQAASTAQEAAANAVNANQTAIQNTELAIRAASTAQQAGQDVETSVGNAADTAAQQAVSQVTSQMQAYLDAAEQAANSAGKSAYQIWLDEGNNGSEADFLLAIRGAVGAQGAKGEKGDTGAQGAKGDKGDTGASAYQTWLDAGNTGTESDFLSSLNPASSSFRKAYSNPELSNGWQTVPGEELFISSRAGVVSILGRLEGGGRGLITTLPDNLKPWRKLAFVQNRADQSSSSTNKIEILPNGQLVFVGGPRSIAVNITYII